MSFLSVQEPRAAMIHRLSKPKSVSFIHLEPQGFGVFLVSETAPADPNDNTVLCMEGVLPWSSAC